VVIAVFSAKNHLVENDWGGPTVTEFRGPHSMEEGKGKRYLAPGRQYGNALLGVRHQEEEGISVATPMGATSAENKTTASQPKNFRIAGHR